MSSDGPLPAAPESDASQDENKVSSDADNKVQMSSESAPIDSEEDADFQYRIPEKEILLPDEIGSVWEKSHAYEDLLGFITAMSEAIKDKKMTDQFPVSQTIEKLVSVLNTFDQYIDETPAHEDQTAQRFGNKAFRDWFSKIEQNCERLLREALPQSCHPALAEVSVYLRESVGNSTRIDYGTGHELAFVAFLCCLYKIGALEEQDAPATVLTLFHRYVALVRRLLTTYRMEPAGSQGVWNLDDFCFVPFIWGSAQLIEHARLKPKHYPEAEMCAMFATDYMFFAAVHYIHQVKTGPFHEHSNQLWNISGVKLWSKVHSGLVKMYKAEVLNKFPVIQHFLFGSLLSVEPTETAQNT